MIKEEILRFAHSDPKFAQTVEAMLRELESEPAVPEDMDEAIKMLEFVLHNPDKYPEVRQAAVADGLLDDEMLPQEFDMTFIVSLLAALYSLQDHLKTQGYARGGLAKASRRLRAMGRGGDSELVHVNPREEEMLRRIGGAGTVNPNTGLREYKFLKKLFKGLIKWVAPIALSFVAPGIGTALGAALRIPAMVASTAVGAGLGAAGSAIAGGDPLKGALYGGLGGGLGSGIGSTVNKAAGLGLSEAAQTTLGSGLVGAGASAVTGDDPLRGAAMGALGSFANTAISKIPGLGQMVAPPKTGGIDFGKSGMTSQQQFFGPQQGGGFQVKTGSPLQLAGGYDPLRLNTPQATQFGGQPQSAGSYPQGAAQPIASPATPDGGEQSAGVGTLGKMALGAVMLGSLTSAPQNVRQAISTLSPAQKEYFNRPNVSYDWDKLQQDANASNLSLDQYIARNWNDVYSGEYEAPVVGAYRGGALSNVARFAQGAGSGRDDTIPARVSDGEFIFDAESVALIGDGSSKEGAKRLEAMRTALRKHKGKALMKGRFSPKAKSPLSYIKEVA